MTGVQTCALPISTGQDDASQRQEDVQVQIFVLCRLDLVQYLTSNPHRPFHLAAHEGGKGQGGACSRAKIRMPRQYSIELCGLARRTLGKVKKIGVLGLCAETRGTEGELSEGLASGRGATHVRGHLHGSLEVLRTLSFNRGDLLVLTSEIGWVTYTLYSRATTTQLAPVTIMAGAHVVSSALLLPLALAVEGVTPLARAGWSGWGVVLYGAFPVTLGHLWFYQAIRAVGAGRAAVFTNLVPFLVIVLSWAVLGEPIRWYHAVGATVVIAGVVLTTRR